MKHNNLVSLYEVMIDRIVGEGRRRYYIQIMATDEQTLLDCLPVPEEDRIEIELCPIIHPVKVWASYVYREVTPPYDASIYYHTTAY
jgi:hypothetical protein